MKQPSGNNASGKENDGGKAHHREGVPGFRTGDDSPISAIFRGLIHLILYQTE